MNRVIVLFCLLSVHGLTTVCGQDVRGLYVNGIDTFLGNEEEETTMLNYLRQGNFNSITFYSLYRIDFRNDQVRQQMRNLIRTAREEYGITRFGAASESLSGFVENIHLYNQDPLTLPEDRFDHYNVEFEFWSTRASSGYYCTKYLEPAGYPCNPDGAFSFVCRMLRDLREQTLDTPDLQIEMYVGWLTEEHAATLTTLVDRVLYAVYREMDVNGQVELYDFPNQRKRLEYLGQSGKVKIAPIFTSFDETEDHNLASWLRSGHTVCEAWDLYNAAFQLDHALPNRKNLIMDGYQWFKYSSMPPIPTHLRKPGPIFGPQSIHLNQQVKFTIPPDQQALKYEWSILKDQHTSRHLTLQPVLNISFPDPGAVILQVRSLGCGKVSPPARIRLNVDNLLYQDESLSINSPGEFGCFFQDQQLHISPPEDVGSPFHIQVMHSSGRIILRQTFSDTSPFTVRISENFQHPEILFISIRYPGGSFSKKISTLDSPELN